MQGEKDIKILTYFKVTLSSSASLKCDAFFFVSLRKFHIIFLKAFTLSSKKKYSF